MILPVLIVSLLLGGGLAWLSGRWSRRGPRFVALAALLLHFGVLLLLWGQRPAPPAEAATHPWLLEFSRPWLPGIGISLHLAVDGISLLLLMLTDFLGVMAILASWRGIQDRVGFFHFNLLWILAGLTGVFLALDLFLFYFFWEVMLVPLYFLIGIWGHEHRVYAALKFFIFTQASSLLMLLAILGLYFTHGNHTGVYTFDYTQLLGTALSAPLAMLLMLGFVIAFLVKLPAVPLHTWLPDAHTEAPTAGSIDLAGLVLKVGAYGLLRFAVPLFPAAAARFAPIAMALGVAGIVYGAVVAYSQSDLKRLVAYTSVSHMGFVLMGIFAWNELALQGALIVMLAHGVSTSALFVLVGSVQERTHSRDLRRLNGLWETMPRMGGLATFFAVASLGLPGIGNFVGEFLVLLGVYQVSVPLAVLGSLGLIVATLYSLAMLQRAFFGPNVGGWKLPDTSPRELAMMAAFVIVALWLGLYPRTFLDAAAPAVHALQANMDPAMARQSQTQTMPVLSERGSP